MAFELYFYKYRTETQVVTLEEADGNGLTLNAGDKVRFKVWRRDQSTPVLDMDSISALAGGSVVTVTQTASAAEATIKVCQVDVSTLDPGPYSASIEVVDSGDSNLIKMADEGVFQLLATGGGDLGVV